MNQKLFIKKLSLFTLSIAGILFVALLIQDKFHFTSLVWFALLYYFLLALATGLITQSGMKKSNKTFMSRTYSAIGIRLVFSVFPLLIYLLFSPSRDFTFIVVYILLYFFYTSFEIYFLVVNLRPDSKK